MNYKMNGCWLTKFILLMHLWFFNAFAHASTQNKLSKQDWYVITKDCLNYLRTNAKNLKISTNESGFYRIRLNLNTKPHQDIISVRLNYWSGEQGLLFKENIHNHPNYFESKIISGGYEHEIFLPTDSKTKASSYISCKLGKDAKGINKILAQQKVYLTSSKIEKVQAGQILALETSVIHKILKFTPNSLSINAVFNNKKTKNQIYNVFFTQNTNPELCINNRKNVTNKDKDIIILAIINLLEQELTK